MKKIRRNYAVMLTIAVVCIAGGLILGYTPLSSALFSGTILLMAFLLVTGTLLIFVSLGYHAISKSRYYSKLHHNGLDAVARLISLEKSVLLSSGAEVASSGGNDSTKYGSKMVLEYYTQDGRLIRGRYKSDFHVRYFTVGALYKIRYYPLEPEFPVLVR